MNLEIEIYEKYGLFWADSSIDDSSGHTLAEGFYIPMPDRFSECFWILFDRLGQVNDYCFHSLLSSEKKLNDLKKDKADLESGKVKLECASQLDFLNESIPSWTHNVNIISQSSVLVILASFVEWGLKRVVQEFLGGVPKKQKQEKSKIDGYIRLLKNQVFPDLVVPQEIEATLDSFRKARNEFAHGDWEKLRITLATVNLREAFESVAELFTLLEESAWSSQWANTP